MSKNKLSRRSFLDKTIKTTAAAALGFPYFVQSSALGSDGSVAPSNRITLGFIGVGAHGTGVNLGSFLPQADAHVLAVCDVDRKRQVRAQNKVNNKYGNKDCDTYNDFRDLIARKDIDAVVISTPDHWHVIPAIQAAKAGKDVFCEKPLTLTIHEGRVLSDTMQKYGRIFQTASENRSKWQFVRACELVRNGRIGKLQRIETEMPAGHNIKYGFKEGLHETQPIPEGFDYDMWLGQAPEAPYTPGRCHYNFRWILDYSGGELTDWGAHINDIAQWCNNTEHTGPVSVDGKGLFLENSLYTTATNWKIDFEYANGVKMLCKSGNPRVHLEGTDGWVSCSWGAMTASSDKILKSVIGPNEFHPRTCSEGEQRDFLNCVKTRQQAYGPAEIGHRTITLSHLGNISMRLGRKLQWNPDTERFVDDAEADRMLSRPMRGPWHL